MRGFVDLHCHYVPAIDDGVRTEDDGMALLRALRAIGFDHVVATPHMRPSMFDNSATVIREAYAAMSARIERERAAGELAPLPQTSLAAEHFFDEKIYALLLRREGLGYGAKGRAVLVEFGYEQLPVMLPSRFFDLRRTLQRPVVAHPERYEPFHRDPNKAAETMRRAGGVLLLDVAALVGKYGTRAQSTAEALVESDAYYAACSDAHRPEDAEVVARAIERLERMKGASGVERLLKKGPRDILEANILDVYD